MVQIWEMRGREFSDLNKLDSHLLRGQGWNGDLEVTVRLGSVEGNQDFG